MLLAEMSLIHLPSTKIRPLTYLPYPIALLGLYLCSYPNEFADWTPWSRALLHLGQSIVPAGKDLGRFWPGLGAQLLCASIVLSPHMRSFFSHEILLWLGNLSYPLYLLHGPLMRSVLAIMTFLPIWLHFNPKDENGFVDPQKLMPLPRPLAFVVILPVFWVFLLLVVHSWARNVEPLFAMATKKFEDFAYGKNLDGTAILPTQTQRD